MPQGTTRLFRAVVGLGAMALLTACFVSSDQKKSLNCDEAATRGFPCEPDAGSAGVSGVGGSPAMGASGSTGAGTGGAGGNAGTGGSGGLACTAPAINCGGTCVEVKADDATNCGVCGRSCLGMAMCKAGACVPEVMAQNEVAPYALADDGTNLYWVSPAVKNEVGFIPRMRRVAKASPGGLAQNAFASTIVRSRSLAFGGGKLYWGDLGASPSDNSQRLASGLVGSADATTVEAAQLNVQHVALAGGKVYWSLTGDSAVRGKAADGTGALAPNIGLQSSVGWLAVDGEAKPYWLAGVPREVRRLAASPANAGEKVADSTSGVAVELAGGRVYWADGVAVRSAAKTETVPTAGREEFAGHGKVEGFRVEVAGSGGAGGAAGASGAGGAGGSAGEGAATLYVVTVQGQKIQAWRKGPDDEALLLGEVEAKAAAYAGNPFGAAYVLVDGQYVYFADVGTVDTGQVVPVSEGNGVIYRAAK